MNRTEIIYTAGGSFAQKKHIVSMEEFDKMVLEHDHFPNPSKTVACTMLMCGDRVKAGDSINIISVESDKGEFAELQDKYFRQLRKNPIIAGLIDDWYDDAVQNGDDKELHGENLIDSLGAIIGGEFVRQAGVIVEHRLEESKELDKILEN